MGEIGAIDQFRIVAVPEMLNWAGVGATVATNPGYRATSGRYDVFPMLVVGAESFTTIGFQTDGKSFEFEIITKMPGEKTADFSDPYGEKGFSSMKWYYGFMAMCPERLGLVLTVARQQADRPRGGGSDPPPDCIPRIFPKSARASP